jgi:hypothetical protein
MHAASAGKRQDKEIIMSWLSQSTPASSPIFHLRAWFRDWRRRRRTLADLDFCGAAEAKRMARDVGVSPAELRVLAGKWPDELPLLTRRMAQEGLDRDEIVQSDIRIFRDLQRVCSLCKSKRHCELDLAYNPSHPSWRDYCPNATTLAAVAAERHGCTDTRTAGWNDKR